MTSVITGITGRQQGPGEKEDCSHSCSCYYEQENPFLVPWTKLHHIPLAKSVIGYEKGIT